SEAIISFRPGEGQIIEANMQAERLLGRPRAQLLGLPLLELFPAEHRPEIQWLIEQRSGSNMRLEDMAVRRADGLIVPVSLSCNWINVDGQAVAQAILRDMTQQRQMQRELQDHAERLEERVTVRTKELRQSEERYRALFLQEQRRAQHLSLINEVQKSALATRDIREFLHQAAHAIQSHFQSCDVTFYLCAHKYAEVLDALRQEHTEKSGGCGDLIAVAQAGGHGLSMAPGGRHPGGTGLPGNVAQRGETLYITQGAATDQRYTRPPGVHRDAESQLCVPVIVEREIIGVICLQSEVPEIFDARDAVALQTVTTILASHIQWSRLYREMRELSEFNQNLIATMLHSLMVVDREGRIQMVNARLRETLRLPREALLDQPITSVLGEHLLGMDQFAEVLREVTETGTPREIEEVQVRIRPPGQPEIIQVFDLRIFRVYFRGEAQAVVLMLNITSRWRKAHQLQLMNEVGRLFQSSLDIDRVLHTVLTCITAGSALGFNRAFLLLRDEGSELLRGRMALGPSSWEEANWIWFDITQRQISLQEMLEKAIPFSAANPTPLQERTLRLTVDVHNPCFTALSTAIRERRALRARQDELVAAASASLEPHHEAECQAMRALFTASFVAIAPLVAKERVVGVVLADNLYSGTAIEPDDIQLLDTLAQQAGLAIDNALTFQALQKAQKELVSAEKLATIGEMAARVSHEIRNPLATIGGFARSILKHTEDTDGVRRKTGIVVDEVARLEELLTDLLDMTRPSRLDLQPHNINEIVEHALLLAEADIKGTGVVIVKQL
ncbi:MAG: GAF domain-containing protein, partial [Armatimonadota bacterium]|nr:GAF domain-containing protein [Armatimonadota bacterium]